jgi:DNA-binding HxlR family transcriptional regulator
MSGTTVQRSGATTTGVTEYRPDFVLYPTTPPPQPTPVVGPVSFNYPTGGPYFGQLPGQGTEQVYAANAYHAALMAAGRSLMSYMPPVVSNVVVAPPAPSQMPTYGQTPLQPPMPTLPPAFAMPAPQPQRSLSERYNRLTLKQFRILVLLKEAQHSLHPNQIENTYANYTALTNALKALCDAGLVAREREALHGNTYAYRTVNYSPEQITALILRAQNAPELVPWMRRLLSP